MTALKQKMDEYIREDFPIVRKRISRQEAIAQFRRNDQPDKAELLQWSQADSFDEYVYKDYSDYGFE